MNPRPEMINQHTLMSMNQMLVAVVEVWEKISPEIIKRSFVVVGQVPNVDINDINCFKLGKVDLKNLFQMILIPSISWKGSWRDKWETAL